ncbi:uncharacterized protein BDW70DRAFT_133467 [Aspergillus foveolatus]|uniref:uncharacterized protein n=1 Tax=Aspergillus foveolatus TaxID=210207 RepID=UPI003CCD407B
MLCIGVTVMLSPVLGLLNFQENPESWPRNPSCGVLASQFYGDYGAADAGSANHTKLIAYLVDHIENALARSLEPLQFLPDVNQLPHCHRQ